MFPPRQSFSRDEGPFHTDSSKAGMLLHGLFTLICATLCNRPQGAELNSALTITRRDPVNETMIVSDPAHVEAEEIVTQASGSELDGFYILLDGKELPLGDNLSRLVAHVIEGAANRGSMTIRTMPQEVSTTVAAHELGVSRPTLMKMVRAGDIPSHVKGSHTRIRFEDVLEASARLAQKKDEAFVRLLQVSEALGER